MATITRTSLVLVTALALPGLATAQVQDRTIYASVVDRAGAPVTALSAGDFIVREDGMAREVLSAAPASEPMQIAVLVDTSQAIEPHVSDLRNGLTAFFKAMHGKHDIALYSFGERPTLLVDFTRDLPRLQAGVGRVFAQSRSGAYVLDAIVEVSRSLRMREGARSAIVVITAEGPEFSERYHQTVLDELDAAHATLHSVVLTRPGASLRSEAAREREFTLAIGASTTGGRRDDVLTSMAFAGSLEALALELTNQYQIVYARPAALIPPERVDVKVSRSDATVRAPRAAGRGRTRS